MSPVLSFVAGVLVGILALIGGVGLLAAILLNMTEKSLRKLL